MMMTTQFFDCRKVGPGTMIEVETKNRHYHIECLGGNAIRISGHPEFCPTPVNVELQESPTNGNGFERGLIGRGWHLKFLIGDSLPVRTSTVLSVRVQPSEINPSNLSMSIH